jgi:dTDP-4-dehydrorhamnose 3,5-epimerase
MPFTFKTLEIPEVVLVTPKIIGDDRGFFLEAYRQDEFEAAGIRDLFVQDNHSRSQRGVLRGLHFQRAPHAQSKLVRCLAGEIYDVALDLRPHSAHYGRWVSMRLKASQMLFVPAGFAHGFEVVSETAEVLYKTSHVYCPEAEGGVVWDDPDLAIPWPLQEPILSARDRLWPRLKALAQ